VKQNSQNSQNKQYNLKPITAQPQCNNMNQVTVALRHCQLFQLSNIHYPGTRRVVKKYPGILLPGWVPGTRGSPTSMNLNVNVNLALRQSHAQLYMHHRLTRYIIIATIYTVNHKKRGSLFLI